MEFKNLKIESKLAELRKKWLERPEDRPLIERQARCLKLSVEGSEEKVNLYKFADQLFNGK